MAPDRTLQLTEQEKASAIAAFEKLGLCTQLAEAAAGLGWKAPSSIQEQAIPHLLQGGMLPLAGYTKCMRVTLPCRGHACSGSYPSSVLWQAVHPAGCCQAAAAEPPVPWHRPR